MTGQLDQFSTGDTASKWWYPESDDQTGTKWVKAEGALEILFWLFFIQLIFNCLGCFLGVANQYCNETSDHRTT